MRGFGKRIRILLMIPIIFDKSIPVSYRQYLIVLILTLLATAPGNLHAADNQVDFSYNLSLGTFSHGSQSPGPSIRLSMPPLIPRRIQPGAWVLGQSFTWSNTWARDNRYTHRDNFLLDYESLHSNTTLSYGISRRMMVGFAYERRDFFGGAMDGLLEKFHELFGLKQDERDRHPRDETHLVVYDENREVVSDLSDFNQFDNSSLHLMGSYILHPGTRCFPAIGISGLLSYGMNTPFKSNGPPLAAGIGIGLSKRWRTKWYSYHTLNYVYYNNVEVNGLKLKHDNWSTSLAVAWYPRPSISIIAQYLITEGAVDKIKSFEDPSHEVSLGIKWRFSQSDTLECAFIENIIDYDNSPDFGIHVAYSHLI